MGLEIDFTSSLLLYTSSSLPPVFSQPCSSASNCYLSTHHNSAWIRLHLLDTNAGAATHRAEPPAAAATAHPHAAQPSRVSGLGRALWQLRTILPWSRDETELVHARQLVISLYP